MGKMVKWVSVAALLVAFISAGMFGPRALSADEEMDLDKAISSAKTAADHEAIAKDYERQADAAKANAAKHREMEAAYKKIGGAVTEKQHLDTHCAAVAGFYEKIAKENAEMAKAHEAMAKATK
jgi:hypothetical protein